MSRNPVKLAYEIIEPKGGLNDHLPPLIFLHALTFGKEQGWTDIPQIIADLTKRKAYNLDARNHWESEWSEEFDFDLNVTDLLHFIEKKQFPKVVLIGHCMGGITAIKAALKANPENSQGIDFDIHYPMRKDSSGQYVFTSNLDVLLKKADNINALIGVTDGIYLGPSNFLIASKSPFQVVEEEHHILNLFPNAFIKHFEGKNHFLHEKFREQFIETIVKNIKLYEKSDDDICHSIQEVSS